MSDGYNGWKNYETWAVALWIDNDQGAQEMFIERARELFNDAYDALSDEMDIAGKASTARDNSRGDLADEIKTWVNDPDLGGMPELPNGLYSGLLQAAVDSVDFYELADHYLADVEPQSEEG